MYQEGKWARELLLLQKPDGSWGGNFHTLSNPTGRTPVTTEQAIRRLSILGYGIQDPPIQKAVELMERYLRDRSLLPDRWEKTHNWYLFTSLMLSAWIRRFTRSSSLANQTAQAWGEVLAGAFSSGEFSPSDYQQAYHSCFGEPPRGGRLEDFVSLYSLLLLPGALDPKTEGRMIEYVLDHPQGVFYLYDAPLSQPPSFSSRYAGRYLFAMELLAGFSEGPKRLAFVKNWLIENRREDGCWDLGPQVSDKIYFPLSDSWRKKEYRIADCTVRIKTLFHQLDEVSL